MWCLMLVIGLVGSIGDAAESQESFNTTPPPIRTNFNCAGRKAGFYADVGSDCMVYHTCDNHGNRYSYRCPEDTRFRQDASICDHAYLVRCPKTLEDPQVGDSSNQGGLSRNLKLNSDEGSIESTKSKFATLEVKSSLFFTNRDSFGKQQFTTRNLADKMTTKSRTTKSLFNTAFKFKTISSPLPSTTTEPSTKSFGALNRFTKPAFDSRSTEDEYSFLQPPPFRNDNGFVPRNFFGSSETSNTKPKNPFFDSIEYSNSEENRPKTILQPPKFLSTAVTPTARSIFNFRNDQYPYKQTLLSIQNGKTTPLPTTTIAPFNFPPLGQFSNSIDQDNDPYYPKMSTTTEAYYTPKGTFHKSFLTTTRRPYSSVKFEIPDVLPDLNSLEDLVDRRKLFFIPRVVKSG